MNLTIKIQLVEAVAETGIRGCTALALFKESPHKLSVSTSNIRIFFHENSDSFCITGNSNKYRLNPFGKFKGDVSKIKAELRKLDKIKREMTCFSVIDDLLH
jgi:hypothetical protein